MKQKYLGRRIISIVLTIAMVFSLLSINSIPVRAEGNDPPSGFQEGATLAPTIKSQPQSINLNVGYEAAVPISVEADPSDVTDVLTFQWYSNTSKSNIGGTSIEGATSSTFNIPTGYPAGNYYFYCIVTATNAAGDATDSTVSEAATVSVIASEALVTGVTITNEYGTAVTGTVNLSWNSTKQVYAELSPDDAADKTVVWTSSDPNVATVSDGVVAPIGVGTATITATATNGTAAVGDDTSASFEVQVNPYVNLVQSFTYTGSREKLISEASLNCWYRVASAGNAGTWVKYTDYTDLSSDALTAKNIGQYTVYYYYGNADPTSETVGTEAGTVGISKANVTIKADDITKAYGETDPTLTATVTGVKGSDALTYSLSRELGNNVGTYKINVTVGSSEINSNYKITTSAGTFTITKAGQPNVVTPEVGAGSTYNGQPRALLSVNGSTDDGTIYYAVGTSESEAPTTGWNTSAPTRKNAGVYCVWFRVDGQNHEDVPATYVGTVTISKKSIAVTAEAKTMVYGDTEPALTYTYTTSDLISGDSFTGSLSRAAGTDAGTYEITLGTLSLGDNYNIQYTSNYLTITQKQSSVTTPPVGIPNLVYDKTAKALVSVGEASNGELQYVIGESATTPPADTAEWSTTVPTGTDAGTYNVWYRVYGGTNNTGVAPVCIPVVIAPKSISVAADAQSIPYGTSDPSLTYTSDALYEGDSFTGALSRATGDKAGTYEITQGTLTAGNNYNITYTGATFTITKRNFVVKTAPVVDELTFNGNAQALVNATNAVVDDSTDVLAKKDDGKLEYILGTDAQTQPAADATEWSTTIPTATDAGTYYVWYRAQADDNHNGTEPVCLTSVIKSATIEYTASGYEAAYDGQSHTGTVTVTAPTGATVEYMIENGSWTDTAPSFSDVCNKVVSYRINAANYSEVTGTFTVNISPKALTVTANPITKKYGETDPELTYTYEGLVDGDSFTGALAREAGDNVGTYAISIGDLSAGTNYEIAEGAYTGANFVITKRTVKLESATATKVYDGSPLTNSDVTSLTSEMVEGETINYDGFATGEGATFNVTGSQTLVGESDNTFTYTLNEGTLADNYDITTANGKLSVTDRTAKYEITVVANSSAEGGILYDGTAKTISGFNTLEFTLDGNKYTVSGLSASGTGTDAGTYPVAITGTAVVKDANDNVVTDQFIVKTTDGSLVINKRNITLTSASKTKQYDGTALTDGTVTVTGDGFVEGQGATYSVTGSQKIVGSSANEFTYTLNEGTSADNYNITKATGTLTISNREAKYEIKPAAKSETLKYNGREQSTTALDLTPVEGVADTYTFEIEGVTYTLSGLTVSGSGINANTYTVSVSGTAIVKDSDGNDVTAQFSVEPQAGTLTIAKRDVTLTSATTCKQYDGMALTDDTVTVGGDGFVEGEGATYNVSGSQTLVGTAENSFTYTLKDGTLADNYNISTIAGTLTVSDREAKYEVKVTANSAEYKYDGTQKTVSGFKIETGDDKTFVAPNGLVYTLSGLTAGISGTDANEYTSNVTGTAVIKDAAGNDVSAQFSIIPVAGKLKINPREVTLISKSAEKVYDGKPLTSNSVSFTGDSIVTGQSINGTAYGEQTLVGESTNYIKYTVEGTLESNYKITVNQGTLKVTSREENPEDPDDKKFEIIVTANSDAVLYDGKEHTVSGFKTLSFEFNGETFTVSGINASVTKTDVGTYPIEITGTPVVRDSKKNDVTNQFIINKVNGSLKINPRTLKLTSATDSKEYDGKALTNDKVTVSGDDFAEGEGATYNVTGTQTYVGSADNAFTYTLNEGTKAANYVISTEVGTLTVTNRSEEAKYQISPETNSGSFKYDGKEHTVSGFVTNEFEVDGNTYTVSGLTATVTAKDAGNYTVAINGTAIVKDSQGEVVTDQFIVTPQAGTLTIDKREVTLTSATATQIYNGKELTAKDVEVTGDGFATEEGATYDVTGTITLVGIAENTFTYTLSEGTKADNYDITTAFGTLTVTDRQAKYEITLKANSINGDEAPKYDGTEKTVSGYAVVVGEDEYPAESATATSVTFTVEENEYTISGMTAGVSGTDAGTYTSNVSGIPVVKDSKGNDVTKQFAVTPESGTLVIVPRSVTLTSATATQVYDGKALTAKDVEVTGDGFAEGEGATYNVTGTQTLVGTSDNTFTYSLDEGTTASNYVIEKIAGKLTVTGRKEEGEDKKFEITVTGNSDEVLYDGKSHTVSGFETLEFTIDDVAYTVSGITSEVSGVNAGEYTTVIDGNPIVKDADGIDVTEQFVVTVNPGKLTINKRKVTLTSASDEMKYDGTELKNDDVTVSEDGFAEGEGASYEVTGVQKVVGSSDNIFTYKLKNGTNAENYIINTVFGTLTVVTRSEVAKYQISPEAKSGTFKYDGAEHEVTGFVADSYSVEGNTFTVEGLTATAKATDAGEYTVTVTGEPVVKDSTGNVVTDQFIVTPKSGTLKIEKRVVTFKSSSADKMYDGAALTNSEVKIGGDDFAEGEGATFDVKGTRTLVGISENTFEYTLNEGTKAENYEITTTYGTLTVNDRNPQFAITLKANSISGEDAVKYDGEVKTVSGYKVVIVKDQKTDEYTSDTDTIEFEMEGNKFTISGMTAEISGTDAGTYTSNVTGMPVIKDSKGNNVSDQFAVTAEAGTLEILPRSVTLTSATDTKVYDGKKLTNDEVTVSGDGFVVGEEPTYNVTGTQTLVGESQNTFTYTLGETTSASNYSIEKVEGKLTVTTRADEEPNKKFEITVTANSDEVLYDGTEYAVSDFETLEFSIDGVDYTVSGITAEAKGTDAGEYETIINKDELVVSDAEGNDVTDQFIVTTVSGKLTIDKRQVTLTSASDKMKYDGTELKNDEVTVSGDGFADGEGATFDVTGVQKVVGSSENAFTYELNEGTKEANYDITVVPGTLTVISRSDAAKYQISPEANSDEVKYDGEEHTVSGFVTDTFTVEGNTYTVSGLNAEVKGTDAGEYTVSVTGTAVVKDSDENDVTDQFVVTPKTGTLKINKREITLTSATDTKVYDGDPLANDEVTVSGDGFVEGEGATYDVTGTRTAVGTSENTFTYKLSDGTKAGNYDITEAYGTLTVNSRDAKYTVKLTANSDDTLLYSGAEQSVTGFKVNGEDSTTFTAENDKTYTISGMSAETKATNAGEYVVNITGTPLIVDSDGNAVTDQFAMTIESGKMTINKREVTMTSATDTKVYDGTALANDEVTITGDGFADGEGADINVNGSQTLPGESKNDFTYTLKEGTSEDNYVITKAEGTLTVTEREGEDRYAITVTANSGEFTYDGTEKEVSGFETLEFTFNGVTYTVSGLSAEAKETNAGTYVVEVTGEAVVTNANGDVLTNNFTVETIDGELVINKADPEYTEPEDLETVYGKTLADIELPEGWTWDDDTTVVGDVGDKEFPATFTPEDTDNYNEVNINLAVTVSSPDKTDLNEAIEEAEEYYDSIKDNAEYGDIPAELKEAIDEAKNIAATDNVTEEEVSDSLTSVDGALDTAKTDVKKIEDDKAAAAAVTNQINALPASGNVTVADKAKIEAARKAYNNLTDDQKARVNATTLKKLADAESALKGAEKKEAADTSAANTVTNTINALPDAANVTVDDKAKIEAARNAYNNLTADQKAKISAETLKKLTDAEAALKKAEDEAAAAAEKAKKYSNEWAEGQWYGTNGDMSYKPKGQWKSNATGWWYEDSSGWYPSNQWQKIDGYWYYFDGSGYMASNEWRDGYWLGSDGAWKYQFIGSWKSDATGWWYEDTSGWYASNQWQKINGLWYYFGGDGYMLTDTTIDGYYVDANGVCQ